MRAARGTAQLRTLLGSDDTSVLWTRVSELTQRLRLQWGRRWCDVDATTPWLSELWRSHPLRRGLCGEALLGRASLHLNAASGAGEAQGDYRLAQSPFQASSPGEMALLQVRMPSAPCLLSQLCGT